MGNTNYHLLIQILELFLLKKGQMIVNKSININVFMHHCLYSLLMGYKDEWKTWNFPSKQLCFRRKDRNIKNNYLIDRIIREIEIWTFVFHIQTNERIYEYRCYDCKMKKHMGKWMQWTCQYCESKMQIYCSGGWPHYWYSAICTINLHLRIKIFILPY